MTHTSDNRNFSDIYNQLFRDLYPELMSYAVLFLPEHEAQIIVQKIFLDIWKKRRNLQSEDQIISQLFELMYKKVLRKVKCKNNCEKHIQLLKEINMYRISSLESQLIK